MEIITNLLKAFWEWTIADPTHAMAVLIAISSTIVGATKTDKDDKVLNFIIKILDNFSVRNPRGTVVVREDEKKES